MPAAPNRAVPTRDTYSELQQAYEHFNQRLFEDSLPHCLITLQREKRTCGYFSAARFASLDGSTTDEIALNPAYFAAVPTTSARRAARATTTRNGRTSWNRWASCPRPRAGPAAGARAT
jgi:hypothetical protein